jgi:hypothetical protein
MLFESENELNLVEWRIKLKDMEINLHKPVMSWCNQNIGLLFVFTEYEADSFSYNGTISFKDSEFYQLRPPNSLPRSRE